MKIHKLHIRDLLWLMLIVAMGCGWWVDQRSLRYENTKLQESLRLAHLAAEVRWLNFIGGLTLTPEDRLRFKKALASEVTELTIPTSAPREVFD